MSCDATSDGVRALGLGLVLFLFPACSGEGGEYLIERIRPGSGALRLDRKPKERFSLVDIDPKAAQQSSGPRMRVVELIEWTVPDGFEQLPARQYRDINLGSGAVELYMTQIDAGGPKLNLDRWRRQMGLKGLSAAELEAAKSATLLQIPAYRLDLRGSYRGMGSKSLKDARMLAVYAQFPRFAVSVKMIGPAAEVGSRVTAFDAFCRSMVWNEAMKKQLEGGGRKPDPHATGAPKHPGKQAPQHTGSGRSLIDPKKIRWQAPEGWEKHRERQMRLVSFRLPDGVECYMSAFPGDVGGLRDNLDRWLGAAGVQPRGMADIEGLEKLPFLGGEGRLLEAYGGSRGVLVLFFIEAQQSIFVRLNGKVDAVRKHRQAFLDFCKGLEVEK